MKKFRPSKTARDYLGHSVVGAAHAHVTQAGNVKFKVSYNPPTTKPTSAAKDSTTSSENNIMFSNGAIGDDVITSGIPLKKVFALFHCETYTLICQLDFSRPYA
jgi:hypothetical protein